MCRYGFTIVLACLPTVLFASDRVELSRLRCQDTLGAIHRPGTEPGTRAVAVIFLSSECPIATAYLPRLKTLTAEFRAKGIEWFGVISDPFATRQQVNEFVREYEPPFPIVFDTTSDFAWQFRPSHVPEAFVLALDGTILYRGRIDDRYIAPGKRRAQTQSEDLLEALQAVVDGKKPPVMRTDVVGCIFEAMPKRVDDLPKEVTYHRHIAPILNARCVNCHRPGEVAPFALQSYADAGKRAKMIARVTLDRSMPPWKAVPGYGHFMDEMLLSDRELALLRGWAENGAIEGDVAEAPPTPKFVDGWQLGKPDLIIRMPEPFQVPATGPDPLRNFVIPIDIPKDQMVGAIEFRPGNRRVVHHALCYLDGNRTARKLDAADPAPGYDAAKKGLGFFPTGSLAGWAPGTTPRFLPDGMGRHLAKGSDAVLQIHYHPTGKPETDQSELGVYFVRKPAKRYIGGIALENWKIDIPPGAKRYHRTAEYRLPTATTFIGAAPHMHTLGNEMKCWAELPDGTVRPLVHIRRWDFNWQDYYVYREPFTLPKGTILKMEAWLDNPTNQRVRWGEGTNDEMAMCIFEVTCDDVRDLLRLIGDDIRHRQLIQRAIRAVESEESDE